MNEPDPDPLLWRYDNLGWKKAKIAKFGAEFDEKARLKKAGIICDKSSFDSDFSAWASDDTERWVTTIHYCIFMSMSTSFRTSLKKLLVTS